MVAIRSKVTIRRRGDLRGHILKIEKALQSPTKVKVGLPAGKSPADIVSIAVWNHFGTSGSGKGFSTPRGGGFGGPIPARPFITVAMFKHRGEIRMNLRKIAHEVTINGKPLQPQMERLGQFGAGVVQKTISGGVGPPNSPLTISIKGSSKQLIDGGRMFGSITWALDYGSGSGGMGFKGGSK